MQVRFLTAICLIALCTAVQAADSCSTACSRAYAKCVAAKVAPSVATKSCGPQRTKCLVSCSGTTIKPKQLPPPSKVSQQFYEALQRGNYEMMAFLLKQGADINCGNCGGQPPLAWATLRSWYGTVEGYVGGLERVDWLLARGANPAFLNYRERGATPLIHLAQSGGGFDFAYLAALVERGAEVNAVDVGGNTALLWLASDWRDGRDGRVQAARMLLDKGSNINHQNILGRSALMRAAEACSPGAARDLLGWGANAALLDKAGNSALALAIESATKRNDESCNESVRILSSPIQKIAINTHVVGQSAGASRNSQPIAAIQSMAGNYQGLIASSLAPGVVNEFAAAIFADGKVAYTSNGVTMLDARLSAPDADGLSGKGTTRLPKDAAGKQLYYTPGVSTAEINFSLRQDGKILRGMYGGQYENGEFMMCRDREIKAEDCLKVLKVFAAANTREQTFIEGGFKSQVQRLWVNELRLKVDGPRRAF